MNKEIANKIERNLALLTLAQIMEFIKNNCFSTVFTTLHKNPHSISIVGVSARKSSNRDFCN